MSSRTPTGQECHRSRDESAPLLQNGHLESGQLVSVRIARRLYVSHFLSTWNSRVFEFGAVLYLATIFPGTLLPMSAYALTRGLSAIFFASVVGHYIDGGNRLQVVRVSIVLQRFAVAISCGVFYALTLELPSANWEVGLLVLITVLACVEKLCSIMNQVSVEKDWVIVVAAENVEALKTLNAQMRRIDLLCKIVGLLFIALIDGFSTQLAIILNFAVNAASVGVEYFAIAHVYYEVPELQRPKRTVLRQQMQSETGQPSDPRGRPSRLWCQAYVLFEKSMADFGSYFRHHSFLPSFAGALLYLTVLSFAGQMVTYLLSAGYSSTQIGVARTFSVVFEILATWVAPWLIGLIGPVRAGLWLSGWQLTMLVGGIAVFLVYENNPLISATGLVGGTILSRLGLRGFDLCVQLFVQEDVEAGSRGAFSAIEAAWQNLFEILSYASTIVFFRPDQFKWPSLISVAAVTSASAAYTVFVYQRRGHLLHLNAITRFLGSSMGKQRERERVIDRITSMTDI
ncbi:hypothetical protein LMH87_001402 [Akanthomyces muscarius]|uniref:Solute carrier family 40 member n=1 Tax=Akanthomyces muscarius TaxID=2231603 RepID=A0A9W8UIL8_AKAMU|nr:hypothetical protein LMH87_001402 [Akanthomyces muscarius]KAJ4146843.1 hypothetical protein LMH87_001402 [Akanthomyces muscarius]